MNKNLLLLILGVSLSLWAFSGSLYNLKLDSASTRKVARMMPTTGSDGFVLATANLFFFCEGESPIVQGEIYTSNASVPIDTIPAANMDDPDTILVNRLIFEPIFRDTVRQFLCIGDSLVFGDTLVGSAGFYVDTLTAETTNCDSIIWLEVQMADTFRIRDTFALCAGFFYVLGPDTLLESGVYTDTLISSQGCDSIVTIDLTVNDTFNLESPIIRPCRGDTIFFAGDTILETGDYAQFLQTDFGCDSIYTLQVVFKDTFRTIRHDTICTGDTLLVGDQRLFATDTAEVIFPEGLLRCDSVVEVRLTVLDRPFQLIRDTICRGDTLFVEGQALSESDTVQFLFPVQDSPCDSILEVQLTVLDTVQLVLNDTICPGDSLVFGGNTFKESGSFELGLPGSEAVCDTLLLLHLTVRSPIITELSDTVCFGTAYPFAGEDIFLEGIYFDTLTANSGCDSIISLNLVTLPAYQESLDTVICPGDTVFVLDRIVTKEGSTTLTFSTEAGCDSSVTVNIAILDTFRTRLDTAICSGESLMIGNAEFSEAGAFEYVFPANDQRCDSIVEIELALLDTVFTEVFDTICAGDTLMFDGRPITQPGQYQAVFPPTETRCDSSVLLRLSIQTPTITNLEATICEGESFLLGDTPFTEPGTQAFNFTDRFGCDSTIILQLNVLRRSETNLSVTICEGEQYIFGSDTLEKAGFYSQRLVAANGCDSLVKLELFFIPSVVSTFNQSICEGGSLSFLGNTYTEAGVYRDTSLSSDGCFVILELNLTTRPVFQDTTFAVVCAGEAYFFDTTSYDQTGIYTHNYLTQQNCDSVLVLDLTVRHEYRDTQAMEICLGDTLLLGNQTLTESGIYIQPLTSIDGCDSTIVLELGVAPLYSDTLHEEICEGGAYFFDGNLLDSTGLYSASFATLTGCDSLVVLDLRIEDVDTSVTRGGALLTANAQGVAFQWMDCTDTTAVPGATGKFFLAPRNGSYAVLLQSENCTYLSDCYAVIVTSTEEPDLSDAFRIFPNPAGAELIITALEYSSSQFEVAILDSRGARVSQFRWDALGDLRLIVDDLTPGLYWVHLRSEDGGVAHLKFLKQ